MDVGEDCSASWPSFLVSLDDPAKKLLLNTGLGDLRPAIPAFPARECRPTRCLAARQSKFAPEQTARATVRVAGVKSLDILPVALRSAFLLAQFPCLANSAA